MPDQTLAELARTVSPTARRELAHVAAYQDHPDYSGVHASGIHAATRAGLEGRGLIALHPDGEGRPDRLARVTDLGHQLLDHLKDHS